MKHNRKVISAILAFSITIGLTGCKMVEKTPQAIKKSVVAQVNNKKITRGEIDDRLAVVHSALKEKYGENYEKNEEAKQILKEQRQNAVNLLVGNEIILSNAKELGIKVSQDELKKEIDKTYKKIKENFKTDKEYKEALKKENLTEEKLKARIKEGAEINLSTSKLYDKLTKDIKVEDKEVKDYYNQHLNEFTEKPNGLKIAQIVVDKKEEADEIKKRLDKGEDFAKLAKEKSKDKGTKDKGGEIGLLTYQELYQKPYLTACMGLGKGKISEPVQDTDGYHIVKVLDKTNYPPKKFEEVKERIKEKVLAEKKLKIWQENMEKWQKKAAPKTYEKNLE